MPSFRHVRNLLLTSTALGLACLSGAAYAQTAPADAAPAKTTGLEEVVVTATRQTSTANKVALSISAVTQKNLDKQGVQSVSDLSRQVPGFTFRNSGGDNNPQLTIRGIGGNSLGSTSGGAATTGVYLDEIPLQQRNLNGLETGNGTVTPLLYDLERVEVLKGPQGTLFGGSSEGGTIRFITPTPSLTTYSGSIRLGVNGVQGGGIGDEEGFAIGGPLVQDKLGFRLSGYRDDTPGWINDKSLYTGQTFATNVNHGNDASVNFKLLWQITPDFKATLGFFGQQNYTADNATFRSNSAAQVITGGVFNNTGTVNGVKFSFPSRTFAGYTIPAMTQYGTTSNSNGLYSTNTSATPTYIGSPRRTSAGIPTLNLDYTLNNTVDFKSITTWESNRTSGDTFGGGGALRTGILPYSVLGAGGAPNAPQYVQGFPQNYGYYFFNDRHDSYTEELRATSIDPSSRLQYVAGFFFQKSYLRDTVGSNYNENLGSIAVRGVPEAYFLGETPVPLMQVPGQAMVDVSTRNIATTETEFSGYINATYALIPDKLKIQAGVRYTDYTQIFSQIYGGAVAGAPPGFVGSSDTGAIETNPNSVAPFPTNYAACPTSNTKAGCPYQYTTSTLHEHPVTPMASIQYNLTPSDLLYFTYSQGFRPGGVNPPVPQAQCSIDLARLGLTSTPTTYTHDTVDSFEGGGKFRLLDGAAQLNMSAFRINWNNVQFVSTLPQCAFSYVANGASATSTGFEVQGTTRVGPFLLNGNVSYDNAVYAANVYAIPGNTNSALVAAKGNNLGSPTWTANFGAEYDHPFLNYDGYLRLDYIYTGAYQRTTGVGTSSYFAGYTNQYINGNEVHTMNLRMGVYVKTTEIAFYIKNLNNSQEFLNENVGVGSPVTTGTTLQPRTFGAQINYHW
jgi:iron complex outermembrane receptor protein